MALANAREPNKPLNVLAGVGSQAMRTFAGAS